MTSRLFKRTMDLLSRQAKGRSRRHLNIAAARDLDFDLESLENRQMLAGDVRAVLAGANLTITGDSADNQIQVQQVGSQIIINGLDGTNIVLDGEIDISHAIDLNESGLRNLNIVMTRGSNNVTLDDVELSNNLTMTAGRGDDSLYGSGLGIGGNVVGKMGSGNDQFTISRSGVGGNIDVDLGNARRNEVDLRGISGEYFSLYETRITGDVAINQRANSGHVDLGYANIEGDLEVNTGAGSDGVFLYGTTVSGDADLDLGASDGKYYDGDQARLSYSSVGGNLTVAQSADGSLVGFYATNVDGDLAVDVRRGSDIFGYGGLTARESDSYGGFDVGGDATIDLGSSAGGVDALFLGEADIDGNLVVSQTSGDSFMLLNGDYRSGGTNYVNVNGNLDVSTGKGNDIVAATNDVGPFGGDGYLYIGGDATFNLGAADANEESYLPVDALLLTSANISGSLSVEQTANTGYVVMGRGDFGGVNVGDDLSVSLGSGSDHMSVESKYLGPGSKSSLDVDSDSALYVGGNAEIDLGAAASDYYDGLALSATEISGNLIINQTQNTADIALGGSSSDDPTARMADVAGVVVGNDLTILTGRGSDSVEMFYGSSGDSEFDVAGGYSVVVSGNATVDLGSADKNDEIRRSERGRGDYADLFMLDVYGDLTVIQTANSGNVYLDAVAVGGIAIIDTGRGDDYVDIRDDDYYYSRSSASALTLLIDLGSDDDGLYIYEVTLGETQISLGSGNDSATLEYVDAEGDIIIDMGDDRDSVDVYDSCFYASLEFHGGNGFDSVHMDYVDMYGAGPVFMAIEQITGDSFA